MKYVDHVGVPVVARRDESNAQVQIMIPLVDVL